MRGQEKKAVNGEYLKTAAGTLAAHAEFFGEVRELHTRAAWHEGVLYYELRPGRVISLVNLKTDRERRLFEAYLTTSALPHVPRPILGVTGAMGSGKTTIGRIVKRAWDPTAPETGRHDARASCKRLCMATS